jgi:hypothetical protein
MSFRYQLTRPLAYWSVKGPTISFYRVGGPVALATVGTAVLFILPKQIDIVGDTSLVSFLTQLFAVLPGFFIAALAAIVAFQGGDLDKEMPDVTAEITANGDTSELSITLRLFLCYLFAYLTVLAFAGFFLCMTGALFAPSYNALIPPTEVLVSFRSLISVSYVAFLLFVTASLVLCTIQGLYFLAERVHQTLIDED